MRPIRLNRRGEPILDIASYGRAGPGTQSRLTPAQIEQIRRIVSRSPEVMVKVTGGAGSSTSRGVNAHFGYISRRGELKIETDDGQRLSGRDAGLRLVADWDLDLQEARKRPDLFATNRRKPPKLVHKIVFSMPAGTPPEKVLSAVRDFAREEFGLKHRYAMVLHTDEPHPHVHVVVKAVSEDGVRLSIRKETLQEWREEFARDLRQHGIEANATRCAVRGRASRTKKDGIYRATLRGASTYMQRQVEQAMLHVIERRGPEEPGKKKLKEMRQHVEHGWRGIAPIQTHKEQVIARLLERANYCKSIMTLSRSIMTLSR